MASGWDTGRNWWTPLKPWPLGVRFEDGPTERIIDTRMPPRPVQPGDYGSTAQQTVESPLAGIDRLPLLPRRAG